MPIGSSVASMLMFLTQWTFILGVPFKNQINVLPLMFFIYLYLNIYMVSFSLQEYMAVVQ